MVKLSFKQMVGRAERKGIGLAGEFILFTPKAFQLSVLTRRHRVVITIPGGDYKMPNEGKTVIYDNNKHVQNVIK